MIAHRLFLLALALTTAGCATTQAPTDPSPAQVQEAAHVRVRTATVWGLLDHETATPVVLAVNGQPHRRLHSRLQLDDALYLAPGQHQLAVALVGSPEGRGLAQIEGRTCLTVMAEAHARYLLRGVVEQANFRLDLLRIEGDHEIEVSSQPVSSAPSGADGQPCTDANVRANAQPAESLTAQIAR